MLSHPSRSEVGTKFEFGLVYARISKFDATVPT